MYIACAHGKSCTIAVGLKSFSLFQESHLIATMHVAPSEPDEDLRITFVARDQKGFAELAQRAIVNGSRFQRRQRVSLLARRSLTAILRISLSGSAPNPACLARGREAPARHL